MMVSDFRIRIGLCFEHTFRSRIGFGYYWNFSDRIGSSNFNIRTTLVCSRDYHYPICWLDIRQDSEFATGYGYPKSALKREQDTDPEIQNAFIDISRIQTLEKVANCTIIHLLSLFGSIFSAICAITPSLSMVYYLYHSVISFPSVLIGHAKFVGMNMFLVCQDRALSVYN